MRTVVKLKISHHCRRYISPSHSRYSIPFFRLVTYTYLTAPIIQFSLYTLSVVEIYAILSSALFPHSKTAANQTYDLDLSKGFFVGILLMYSGAIVRATSYRHLGRYFTFELSLRPGHKLITDGPYSIVRHPSYVGSLFFYSGACLTQMLSPGSWFVESGMWTGNGGKLFALAYLGYSITICYFLLSRVPVEDRVLQKEFKEEWVDWSKRTPYRLIPFVY